MIRSISAAIIVLTAGGLVAATEPASKPPEAPKSATILLVHGAFAGSSSWTPVVAKLKRDGYPVIAVANPLRGVKSDADYLARIVRSIRTPVVLVGHSYGGEVISVAAAAPDMANVKSLVFVAGFAPDVGESASTLSDRFPTGTLGATLTPPVLQPDGSHDIYIDQAKYWKQFAADLPEADALIMASTQRPTTSEALAEPVMSASWKRIPSWFIWGSLDKNIPNGLHAFMAKRANAREAIEIKGASHVVMLSHPLEVATMIERAAEAK